MLNYSHSEIQAIDTALEPKLAWALDRKAATEQMALDASRLLSCVDERVADYVHQGFFKRCWFGLSGKNGEVQRANQKDLIEMQKYAWRFITLLHERNLLLAHSMIVVKNNLLTLAIQQEDVRKEICRLADRVYDRFVALEERVGDLEISRNIHGWLLTLDTRDYDQKYPDNLRILRVVSDFYSMKSESWNVIELKYLQKALKEVGLNPKSTVSISGFVEALIDEIDSRDYSDFTSLITPEGKDELDNDFVIDAIAAPSFSSLYQIKHHYTASSRVIRSLQKKMDLSHAEALKTVLSDFIEEGGVDTTVEVPLKDLATEILSCLSLARRLNPTEENAFPPIDSGAPDPIFVSPPEEKAPIEPEKEMKTEPLDDGIIAKIRSGDIYSLLSACDNSDLDPLVKIILSATTNSINTDEDYKKYAPDHKIYAKLIGDEVRSFGGHSLRNAFRGEGPPYGEVVIDVCKKLDIPCVETDGAIIKNEDNLLNAFAPKSIQEMTENDVANAIAHIKDRATSVKNNKSRAAAGILSLVSAPVTVAVLLNSAMSEAYRITAPCVFYISYLRRKLLTNAGAPK